MMYLMKGHNRLFSKRGGKTSELEYSEVTDRLQHLADFDMPEWYGSVICGEIISSTLEDTETVMRSLPERAMRIQRESGYLHFIVFDVARFCDKDITDVEFARRRRYVKKFVKEAKSDYFEVSKCVRENKKEFYEKIVAKGGEGVILKRLDGKYVGGKKHSDWIKVKQELKVDAVIVGYLDGKGKFNQDKIGAIVYGAYVNGKFEKWGRCGGMTNKVIDELTANPDKYIGTVVEVECQGFTKAGNLRHGRFSRLRDDKDPTECCKDELKGG
jgi:ATP-dependent DNA ligase